MTLQLEVSGDLFDTLGVVLGKKMSWIKCIEFIPKSPFY